MDAKTSSSLGSEIYRNGSNFSGSAKLVAVYTRKIVRNLFTDIDFRHSAVQLIQTREKLFCVDFTFFVTRGVRRKSTGEYMGSNYGTYVVSGVFPDIWEWQRIAHAQKSLE
jgi:hypothetical protein